MKEDLEKLQGTWDVDSAVYGHWYPAWLTENRCLRMRSKAACG